MITAIALLCSLSNPVECGAVTSINFYATQEECILGIGNAIEYADTQDAYVRDYKCINWGTPA